MDEAAKQDLRPTAMDEGICELCVTAMSRLKVNPLSLYIAAMWACNSSTAGSDLGINVLM